MKAKVKKTGEIVKVLHRTAENFDYVELEPSWSREGYTRRMWKAEELITPEDIHWQNIRERAAIAALQGAVSRSHCIEHCVKFAVDCADALIEELRKKDSK